MSWMAKLWTGEQIDPARLNPYTQRTPPREKTPEERETESAEGWQMMKAFFHQKR